MSSRALCLFFAGSFLPALAFADSASADWAESRARELGASIHAYNEGSKGGTAWGRAVGVVDATPDEVMKIVNDYERYDEFMPHFKQAKVLSRRGDNALVYMEASILKNAATLWAQLKIKSLPPKGQTRVVEATMQKGNMSQFAATWEITPIDGGKRTLVDFRIIVEPKLPLPDALFSAENKKAAQRSLKAIRKRVTS